MMVTDWTNRTWRRSVLAATAATALGITLLTPAHAQTQDGAITGQVVDPSGDPLPGVTVVAVNPAAEPEPPRTAVTDRRGRYRITNLQIGTYTVIFQLPGFRRAVRSDVELSVSSTTPVDAELAPGLDADLGFGHALDCAFPPAGAIEDCRHVLVGAQVFR